MTQTAPSNPTQMTSTAGKKRFSTAFWHRTGAVIILAAAILFFRIWWARSAVWAVLIAGGTTSTIRPVSSAGLQKLEAYVPEFAMPAWHWVEITANRWLPTDAAVFGVNLSFADIDSNWLWHLKSMTSLGMLTLDQRQIGPGILSLQQLSNLREVKVFGADPNTALQHLGNLTNLERLLLVEPQSSVGGVESLGNLPKLRHLDIEALNIESHDWACLLQQCAGWSNVQAITIRSQFPVTPGLEALRTCDSLRTLEISAPFSNSDIAALSKIEQLTSLVLNVNKLSRDDWLPLRSLQNLTSLKIYSPANERPPLDELRVALPHCEVDVGP